VRQYKPIRYREDLIMAREQLGLTQGEAAEMIGICRSSLQKYEYGQRTPRKDIEQRIQEVLGITIQGGLRSA